MLLCPVNHIEQGIKNNFMKRKITFSILITLWVVFVGIAAFKVYAAAYPPVLGGTGTTVAPLSGQVLIGNASSTYTPAYLTAGVNITLTTSSGGIIVSAASVSTSTGANPSAQIGLVAVNGSANTFLRSDGAQALSQSIIPTWTGLHTFNGGILAQATSTFASSTIITGQLTFGSASGTNISVSGSGTFPTLNFTTGSGTGLSITNATATGNIQTATLKATGAVNASSTLTVEGATVLRNTLTQSGGVVSLASTTINGNATTTNLTITSITSTQCLRATNGVVSGTGSDCATGGGSGTITAATSTYVAYYSASSTINGTSTFTFTPSSGTSTVQIGAVGKQGCIIGRDSDNAGFTYTTFKGGIQYISTTACQ